LSFQQEDPCGGVNRWDVKTLTDKDASSVKRKVLYTTIPDLIKLDPGKSIGLKTPRFGIEFNTYEINCKIKYWIREDDGDLHLVLVDVNDSTKTMIGEIPNLSCDSIAVKTNKNNKNFVATEQEFLKYALKKHMVKDGVYRVKGIGFFDKKHGQTGLAPNGIEIHPILKIRKIK
jgi:hypothetical protein